MRVGDDMGGVGDVYVRFYVKGTEGKEGFELSVEN